MPWSVVPTAAPSGPPSPSHFSPFERMSIDRDGYGYTGYKKPNHNAALSALALISFLFFLNLLQQQLSSGQQQTLLFMINNTGTQQGRRRREATKPIIDFDAEQARIFNRHLLMKYFTTERPKRLSTSPKPDIRLMKPSTSPKESAWDNLAMWLRKVVPNPKELHPQLEQVLSDCRDIVACTLYLKSGKKGSKKHFLDDSVMKAIIASTGEFSEFEDFNIHDACEDLMEMSSDDCSDLSYVFARVYPLLDKSYKNNPP